jgi:T5SS/PEP-CTERM-associated repeat protein
MTQNRTLRVLIGTLGFISITLIAGTVRAQFTADYQTNVIDGVTTNWNRFDYSFDQLQITNGGVVQSSGGFIGGSPTKMGNSVLVSGTDSVWTNGDLYVACSDAFSYVSISGGAALYNNYGYVGYLVSSSNNVMLVTDPGSIWSNRNDLYFGYNGSGNSLTISNGGMVYNYNNNAFLGYWFSGTNTVVVTGTGSIWRNGSLYVGYQGAGNSLIISNGGAVYSTGCWIGWVSDGNTVQLTGTGSVWSSSADLTLGGNGNSLMINNGGKVYSGDGYIGTEGGSNSVVVSGSGSAWINRGDIHISSGNDNAGGNQLTVADSGSVVVASSMFVGYYSGASALTLNGGSVVVASNMFVGYYSSGTLTLNGGTVTMGGLVAANGVNSVVIFNGGTLISGGTSVTNGQVFAVGDGADAATFQLSGGVHSFFDNLEIRNNASLTGCGTVTGNVVVDPGGTVRADCGGTLTFTGIVTNNGTMQAINGSVLEVYGTVVNNGLIDILDGSTNFHGAFINNGTVLDASSVQISNIGISGNDVTIQIPSLLGHTYQLQISPTMESPTWTNCYASQAGTGGVLTFTDPGGAAYTQRFYRVDVTAP